MNGCIKSWNWLLGLKACIMICLYVPAFAQDAGRKLGVIDHKKEFLEVKADSSKSASTELIVPDSFQQAGWKGPKQDSSLSISRSPWVIPGQFKMIQEISIEEQQRVLKEKENEAIYRQQSDPHYFEKMEERFRLEFNQRMKVRGQN